MVVWSNGDIQLRDGDRVSYWVEAQGELDQYYVS